MRKAWSVMAAVFMAVAVVAGGEAEKHHVVGWDRGWEVSNDITSWTSGRIFTVGDSMWFTYSAAQESVVEVGSEEEYLSCDLANPIRMYTDGLNKIPLDREGTRYFMSGNIESCRNGLKLPVTVQSRDKIETQTYTTYASAPDVAPSASARLDGLLPVLLSGLLYLSIYLL